MVYAPDLEAGWPASTEDKLTLLGARFSLKWCDECGDWEHSTGEEMEISIPTGNPELHPGPM